MDLTGCLMASQLKVGVTGCDVLVRFGGSEPASVQATNCCYLQQENEISSAIKTTPTQVTVDQLKSGEVTYLLNRGAEGAWKQTIGTDTAPTLDSTHDPVLKVTFTVVNGTGSTALYMNPGKLTEAQVPTVTAADDYTGGAWDTQPAGQNISQDSTFIYTFEKIWAKNIIVNGNQITLKLNDALSDTVKIVAAFYKEGQMTLAAVAEVNNGTVGTPVTISLPEKAAGTVKLFLMNAEGTPLRQPIQPSPTT